VRPEDVDLAWARDREEVARLRHKAVDWLRRAADAGVARYELDEGLELLYRALDLADDRRAQASLWHAIGKAHAYKFDAEPFWRTMEKAIELCDDEELTGDLYSDLA
jgi:hypothetical protein